MALMAEALPAEPRAHRLRIALLVHVRDHPAREPDEGLRIGLLERTADGRVASLGVARLARARATQPAELDDGDVDRVRVVLVPARAAGLVDERHDLLGESLRIGGGGICL